MSESNVERLERIKERIKTPEGFHCTSWDEVEFLCELAEQAESFKKLHKSYLDKYVDAVGERNVLQEENKKLREALEFYADAKNYEPNVVDQWAPVVPVDKDYGEIARAVLEEIE